MFNIRILLKGQMKIGLNENGSRLSLVSCKMLKKMPDAKRIVPYNNTVLSANKIFAKFKLLLQMKPKSLKILHKFFVTDEENISLLLGLDIPTNQKCKLILNEKTSLDLITQNVDNVSPYALLLNSLVILAKHEAWIDVIVKNSKATEKIQGIKHFQNCTCKLLAHTLIYLDNSSNQLRIVNLSNNDNKFFKYTKIGEDFSNDDSI